MPNMLGIKNAAQVLRLQGHVTISLSSEVT